MITMNAIKNYAITFKALLYADLIVFKKEILNKIIDNAIVVVINLLVMGFILQRFGLQSNFGLMMVGGLIPMTLLFYAYPFVFTTVGDIEGPRTISYYLTLPIPSGLILLKNACSIALQGFMLIATIIPLAKLVLGSQLDLTAISWGWLLIMSALSSFFFGVFSLWVISMIKNMSMLSSVFSRFIFPLWMLGGFQFSWQSIHLTYPWFSYIALLNPFIYTTEGIRASIIGQEEFLPFWSCVVAIIFFTVCFWCITYKRLKKRLDFV